MPPSHRLALAAVLAATLGATLGAADAAAQPPRTLRIGMTAADVPTTTGMPNNGFEGMRFLGFPIFEGLTLWDLSRDDAPATIRPGLAERYEQDPADPRTWIFHLRPGVTFHDGSPLNADAIVWNLDRYFRTDSPQFEPAGSGITRARVTILESYRKRDDMTVSITTTRPASYFPYMIVYALMTSPKSWEDAGHDWARVAALPAAGTGPFRLSRFTPRVSAELARYDGYWDHARVPHLDRVLLTPIPDATARLAALRSGQVDWIEVPPPDAVPSLRSAGFTVTTGPYPHIWPWFLQTAAPSPLADRRVRQALNYCVDRDALVGLLNGTAAPATGWLDADDPAFGTPQNRYGLDPARGRALLAEAGYTAAHPLSFRVAISASGSGQMVPLPMNEVVQQSLKESCGVDVSFEVLEWNTLFATARGPAVQPILNGSVALNISSPTSDPSVMVRYFTSGAVPPNGFNWEGWRSPEFDAAITALEGAHDPAALTAAYARAHATLVDDPPWLFLVHDLNPRAMTRRVHGFVGARSWFLDLVPLDVQ